jgi:hypothetical protein
MQLRKRTTSNRKSKDEKQIPPLRCGMTNKDNGMWMSVQEAFGYAFVGVDAAVA